MALLIRDLKPALANVLGTIKRNKNLPTIEAAKITVGDGELKILATDRFAAFVCEIEYKTDTEFSYVLDGESLQLLAKLPPLQQVEFTPSGVVAKNIKFTPADLDFPTVIQSLIDAAWKDEWLEEQGHNTVEGAITGFKDGVITGYKPEIVKHIKDVEIIPQPHGGKDARLRAPGLRGLLMGTRVKLEEISGF